MLRDYYKTLIVSLSGKGKTYSFRNMNPDTTGFINVENKPLPFKNKFKYHFRPKTYLEAYSKIIEYGKNPEIRSIVLDSFSAYADLLLYSCRNTTKGFDTWNLYNEEIGKLLNLIKAAPKEVFVTAHYELIGIEGNTEKRVKTKGKEWEGVIEKEFAMVIYSGSDYDDETKKFTYSFSLALQNSSAKCPPDIFGEDMITIPNDTALVLKKIQEFVS